MINSIFTFIGCLINLGSIFWMIFIITYYILTAPNFFAGLFCVVCWWLFTVIIMHLLFAMLVGLAMIFSSDDDNYKRIVR